MRAVLALALLFAALPGAALAHYPFCHCATQGPGLVRCQGGFSDGAPASGVPFQIIGYDEQVLAEGRSDPASAFEFKRPKGEFYVLFDAGPGHVVEVDHADIK